MELTTYDMLLLESALDHVLGNELIEIEEYSDEDMVRLAELRDLITGLVNLNIISSSDT